MSRVLSRREIWGIPVVLGVLSLVGLVAALVADGFGDVLSWIALTVPTVVCVWGFSSRRAASRSARREALSPTVARPRGPGRP